MYANVKFKSIKGNFIIHQVEHLTILGFAKQLDSYKEAVRAIGLELEVSYISEGSPCLDGSSKAEEERIEANKFLSSHILNINKVLGI